MSDDRTVPESRLTKAQYDAGYEFMRDNFACNHPPKCEGCEIDFRSLLDSMEIGYDA